MKEIFLYYVPYGLLGFFFFRVITYVRKHNELDFRDANQSFLDNIPSIFTTIGIFGTFLGIVVGLWSFDSDDIDRSIPLLLDGLKTSFITSLIGLFCSLISKSGLDYLRNKADHSSSVPVDDELNALKILITSVDNLSKSIVSKSDDSLSNEFVKLRTMIRDNHIDNQKLTNKVLDANRIVIDSLGGDGDTSLLSQLIRFREEARENTGEQLKAVQSIEATMSDNTKLMAGKFDEFTDLLEKSNTDALVSAISNVMSDFNEKFNDLISKLVQENFAELNNSVKSLNDWQQEYKSAVTILINQLKQASGNLVTSSQLMENISNSTDRLTNNDGRLVKLIKELEEVISEEGMFKSSVSNLHNSTKELHESSENFKDWSKSEKNLIDEISDLIQSLKEIENLRNKSGQFWSDIKENMHEGTSILSDGNERLLENVEVLETSFNERMDTSFRSLDKVLQAMVMKYKEESGKVFEYMNN